MSPESLAIKLRQARGAMSLAEAAELSEIPEERIRMYEEGVRRPYGKTLRRLAEIYGVRVPELVGTGQVVRGRGRAPEGRRRRRRIVVPAEEGAPIALPLEVREGQTVRLVIELVVRRREEEGPEDEAATDEVELRVPPARVNEAPASGPDISPPRPASGTGGLAARAAEPALRRPRAMEEPARGEPQDPITELKRAYRDFRHKKG